MNALINFCQHVYDKGDGFGLLVALAIICGAISASVNSVTKIFRKPKPCKQDKAE